MNTQRWTRVALGYLALVSLEIGVWAQFAPRSFYDHFPGFGRAWVRVDGPYNVHLVRDVGGLNLALAALLTAALFTMSRSLVVTASIASLLFGVPHVVHHIANTTGLASSDKVLSIGGLALFVAIPLALLVVHGRRPPLT